ncbi:MAG: amidohydrolase family protein [Ferruginibacter sp.]
MKYLFLLLLPIQLFSQETSVLFKQVNVVDVQTGKLLVRQNVLVTGNRIDKITSKSIAPGNATVVNGTGKFLMPALWDMHVHVFNNVSQRPPNDYYFPGFIANGVCSVREMWTKPNSMPYVQRWRTELDSLPGTVPRFVRVGTLVDGLPKIWPNSDTVTNAEEARAMVRRVMAGGVDFFKVYGHLSRESYFAIADECKKLNFPFEGHVPVDITMAEASNAGQKSQEHTGFWAMFTELSDKEEKFKKIKPADLTPTMRTELFESISEKKITALAATFVKNGTALCPTLVTYRANMLGNDKSIMEDERLQYAEPADKKDWAVFAGRFKPENRSMRETRYQKGLYIIRLLQQAGVLILAGTDLGNPFLYAGFSLHDELSVFVQAGLSPLAALQTATINPAKYVGKEKEIGTVSQGKLADLVLLDANPLTDIANTKKINAVVANGKLLTRKDLDVLLQLAKEKAANF